MFLLRWIVGIKTEVEGAENIPPGPCIFAAKHMSDWDIFALVPYAERPAYHRQEGADGHPVLRLGGEDLSTPSASTARSAPRPSPR